MKVKKKKRTPLTIANKLDIIHKLESGVSPTAICNEFKVAKQTVSDIKKNKLKIKNFAQSLPQHSMSLNTKTIKSPKKSINSLEVLEKELYEWCFDQSSKGLLIHPSEIQATALQLAKDRGLGNFSASNGWLWRFLKRNNMTTKSCQEKSPVVDEEMEEEKALAHKDYSSIVGETAHINDVSVKQEVLSEDENGYNFDESSSLAEYSHIMKDELHNKIKKEHNGSDSVSLNTKTIKSPNKSTNNLEELEKELYEWWSDQKTKYLLIHPRKIQLKALELAKDRGLSDFSAGNSWLWRFLKRFNMTTKFRRDKSPVFHEEVKKQEKALWDAQESYKEYNTIVGETAGAVMDTTTQDDRQLLYSESSNCSTVATNSPHADVANIPSTSYTQPERDSFLHKGYINEYYKRNKVRSNHRYHVRKSRSILKSNYSKLLKDEDQLSEEMGDSGRRFNNLDQNYHVQRLGSKNIDEKGEINGGDQNQEECHPMYKRRKIEMERISKRIQNNPNLKIEAIVSSLNRIEEQFCKMNQNLEIIAKALSNKYL